MNSLLRRSSILCGTSILSFLTQFVLLTNAVQAKSLSEKILGMEVGLEQEFENYFGENLAEVTQSPAEISQVLQSLGEQTGTTPAVMWAIPRVDHLHLVLIPAGGEPIVRDLYDVPADLLRETVQGFRSDIVNFDDNRHLQAGQQLHRWLIETYEADFLIPNGIDTLLLCMGKGLRGMPLAALHDGKQYLVEKYALAAIPAFNLISTSYKGDRDHSFLSMGASEFEEAESLPAVPLELSLIYQQLSQSRPANREKRNAEKATVGQGQWKGRRFLNEQFTFQHLKNMLVLQSFDVLHLATHADFRAGSPDQSHIQLWDHKLKLDAIDQLPWRSPELLVLSACKTALGSDEAELGFAGLALKSGVKSAIASLWNVSDAGTLALMGELYQELPEQTTKAEALRQAQLAMLRSAVTLESDQLRLTRGNTVLLPDALMGEAADLSHPYYWASFTMISSPW